MLEKDTEENDRLLIHTCVLQSLVSPFQSVLSNKSFTSLIWTLLGQIKVSCIEMFQFCGYVTVDHIGTLL